MSAINTLPNNSLYYQLNGNNSPSITPSSSTDALLQALNGGSSDTSSTSPLDTVNLSPAAQQYLNSLNGSSTASSSSDPLLAALTGVNTTTSTLPGTNTSFTLTTQQQQQITAILEKYQDAPYTQDTFNSIQNDLNNEGLGTTQLSQEDQAKSFNPTAMLIDDLNGDFTDANNMAGANSADEQTKSSNYMQQIISQWQTISGNSSGSSTAASSGAVSAANGTGGA